MKKTLKRVIALISVLAVAFAFVACGGGKISGQTYRASMEPTFPPFDTTDEETGELSGFDVDLLNAIAEDQGFKVEWSEKRFDELLTGLESKEIDIAASGITINDERKQKVAFSDKYYNAGLVLVVRADNKTIKGVDSIPKNAVIAAQVGTSGADYLIQMKKNRKVSYVKGFDNSSDAFVSLNSGRVDAIINDKPVTMEYMSKYPDKFKIVGEQLSDEEYGIAVNKENKELAETINKGLKKLKSNGTYDKLLEKWNL